MASVKQKRADIRDLLLVVLGLLLGVVGNIVANGLWEINSKSSSLTPAQWNLFWLSLAFVLVFGFAIIWAFNKINPKASA